MSICAELFYFFRQIRRGDAQCVCLAGSINISQHEMVGMGECVRKFVEKCFGTCVSVRLENAPYFIVWIMFCSFECCRDLSRMVCIVVNNRDPVELPLKFEEAVFSVEGKQHPLCHIHRNIQQVCHSDSGQRVGYIVISGYRQYDMICVFAMLYQVE